MESEKLLFALCVVCIFMQQPGICQSFDGECSTDDGTYSGKRNITNTGKACYPWRSDNKCFKGVTDVNSTFSHNYCRNPVDPSDCHQDLPWCYTDQNNESWEYCDLPNCGSEPPANCSSALGMGDGRISDDQIFAPTFMDQSSMAKYARLNQTNANFWRASWSYPQYAYLSVNLRIPHFITKIHVQGTDRYFIKRFKILFSLDGYQWEYYTENKDDQNSAREFEGNHAGYDISVAYIKYPFIASKIVIIPVSFSILPTLRIELFGCVSSTNIPLVTEVTTIDSNTYWGLDRSPYIINSAITIPSGVFLTIEAGVKVFFTEPTSSLTVYGCLELRGIKGLEVKFLSSNIFSHMGLWTNPFNYDEPFWNGIFINSYSKGCRISPLKHVVIVGAGVTTGINNINFNYVTITNSKIGLKLTSLNETYDVRDCIFRQNLYGIETQFASSVSVQSSQFIENDIGVIIATLYFASLNFTSEFFANFTFIDTLFKDNYVGIYHAWPWCMRIKLNFTILRSNFSNHRELAISATQYCETDSLYSVVSSVFSNSAIRISSVNFTYSLRILNSTFRDLRENVGIAIFYKCYDLIISGSVFTNISGYSLAIFADIGNTIRINASKFENNTGFGCILVTAQQSTSVHLISNTFLNNLVQNVVIFNPPSSSNIVLSKNIFKNFQSKYEISNYIIRSSNYSILASDNYWGVDDIDNISSRIYDFYRDSSRSFVEILTYFKDESFNEIIVSQNFQLWSQKNSTVGGRLNGNITLSSSTNLTAKKSIYIPKGSCLEIKGPIKLEFLERTGIVVEGGCLKAYQVTLTSTDASWNGIKFINSNGSHLSSIIIMKTLPTFELVNSSLQITASNINLTNLDEKMMNVYNSQIMIKESNLSSDSGCLWFGDNGSPIEVTLLDNVFQCNNYAVTFTAGFMSFNNSLIIKGNKFLRGEINISIVYLAKFAITDNYFNSVLRKDNSFLDIKLIGNHYPTNDEVLIANNVCENVNGSGQSSIIKLSCFNDAMLTTNKYLSAVYLRNNTFRNNNVTNTILTDCIGLTSEKNILDNPNSLYEMKVLGSTSNDVPQLMYFTRNFWGENVSDPNVRVYDDTNDRTLMKVRVDPWYNDTTMTRMVFRSEGFIKPNGEIGGTLTQDVVLLNKGSAYLVTEDITIPTGLKMTIESGVQLNFVSGGINIQGTLVARGNETNYITFNSRDANKRWKGLNFQKPISNSIKKLEFGWWQIMHNGIWKTISFFENSYDKATADVLCKQAGFKESISQAIFQCNSLSLEDKSKVLPCNNSSTPSVRIQCTQNNEFSLQECYIAESQMTYAFYNISCRQEVTESENYVKLQSKSGKWVSFNKKIIHCNC